ncbi:MAG: ribonucleoside-triphosphate reductase, adenosylcobalamin-dependent [Alcaligenaceae bacterium]|nr:MAG: ribonucleoside-triphosphate reductase, adenosylcobalamin-dependent [Alcaligenaceae bacterium]
MTDNEPKFGPTGELVYNRTYSRTKPDGSKESWPETVRRVVEGNLGLVDERYHQDGERERLIELMEDFKVLPAGRHLWASGVKGRQYLFNCHVSHWGEKVSDHFEFTFMRLMEGGGVGANYSNKHLAGYDLIQHFLSTQIVCDPEHPDYEAMKEAGVLSDRYDSDWDGAFEVEDSREGWAAALVDLIDTHYRGDTMNLYRVYDVSRVRASGTRLKTFGGRASGPLPLAKLLHAVAYIFSSRTGDQLDGIGAMEIDHAIAECVVSGGNRRSARMAMMHWADPQINEFIDIKQKSLSHWTTNISVEVDEEFWDKLDQDGFGVDAQDVLDRISEGMVRNGEPGFWDSSLSNVGEPDTVVCTNPCGEIALTPWENCNLGHVNLAAFVRSDGSVDKPGMMEAHRLMTRFLIRATFGDVNDPKQAAQLARQRRIGVGHFGVASFLAMAGIKYSEAPSNPGVREMLHWMSYTVDETARAYAHLLRIPVPVKTRTIAPTGTIAKMPGVSEGIHPIFSKYFIRRIRFSKVDPDQVATMFDYAAQGYTVEDDQYAAETGVVSIATKDSLVEVVAAIYGPEKADQLVEGAGDLTLEQMLAFQALYQTCWADNAVSYTANVDPERYTPADVAASIEQFGGVLKGATIFPEASMPQAPYERLTKEQYEAAEFQAIADGIDENCVNGCPIK